VCIDESDLAAALRDAEEIGLLFLLKGLIIGTSSYFGADSATKKTLPGVY
jgi:hypothetical protein